MTCSASFLNNLEYFVLDSDKMTKKFGKHSWSIGICEALVIGKLKKVYFSSLTSKEYNE